MSKYKTTIDDNGCSFSEIFFRDKVRNNTSRHTLTIEMTPLDPSEVILSEFEELSNCKVDVRPYIDTTSCLPNLMRENIRNRYFRIFEKATYLHIIEVDCHHSLRRYIPFLSSRAAIIRLTWSDEVDWVLVESTLGKTVEISKR